MSQNEEMAIPQIPPRPVTQLDFDQAMKDFSTMFPDMDRVVIEEVLRANQGVVDPTIDQLLAMSTDDTQLEPTPLAPPDIICKEGEKSKPLNMLRGWIPPLIGPLPPNFLRIDDPQLKVQSEYNDDERIALFLQNEEFLSELRINPEFLSTLDADVKSDGVSDLDNFKERLRHMGKCEFT